MAKRAVRSKETDTMEPQFEEDVSRMTASLWKFAQKFTAKPQNF